MHQQQHRGFDQARRTEWSGVDRLHVERPEERLDLALRGGIVAAVEQRRPLELATERYTGGMEDFLGVLDAQRSVYAAEDQLAQSERNSAISIIAVYKALGGGWEG